MDPKYSFINGLHCTVLIFCQVGELGCLVLNKIWQKWSFCNYLVSSWNIDWYRLSKLYLRDCHTEVGDQVHLSWYVQVIF